MNDNDREAPLVFHYSREQRLEAASDDVRDLNDRRSRKRPGLFRTLTATRPLAFLFLSIIMLSLTAVVTNLLVPAPDEADLGGNSFTLTVFRFEESLYVAVKKSAIKKNAYIGPAVLRIDVSGDDGAETSIPATIEITEADSQEFKYRIRTEGAHVEASVTADGKGIKLKAETR